MNPTDLPRITGVAVTSLVCKMTEVVGVHYDVNSLVVEVRDLESDVHWQIAFPGGEGVFLMKGPGRVLGHVPGLLLAANGPQTFESTL